ncbi:MAG: ATP-dependent DNA helicase RecG [Oscillospiraceae bacterium]|nr:ATP-dependent DNA helicase RecG [Oscillospiraceae bacterium]
MATLFDPVTVLDGIGRTRAAALEGLGIRTLYDLIAHFPRDYEDRTRLLRIDQLEPDHPACFEAMVISQPRTSHIRKGLDLTKVTVADQGGRLPLTFFNQPYVAEQLQYGASYIFYGKPEGGLIGTQMTNPSFERADTPGIVTRRILPVYALTAGISNKLLTKAVSQALDACRGHLPEVLPEALRQKFELCDVEFAYETIHRPPDFQALDKARRRLVFEEFFVFSAGLALIRARRAEAPRPPYARCDPSPLFAALPFPLTGAQRRAIDDILADFALDKPMNRLVQGDVGSGKTMIAAAAIYCAAQNGKQAALMAPTEILAEQHYRHLQPLFAGLGVETVLLTGSLGAAAKRRAREAIAGGTAQLVIGTHALLTGNVEFAALDLVIADEQHRFGVAQRAALQAKAENPHLLVMSATPIPRTLSLILYGDLDLSIVDELPPGRQAIDTFLVGERLRARLNGFIRRQTDEGHQVYIVCPAVEEGEDASLKSAEAWAQTLQQTVFPDLTVGLLHGRMKGAEKEAVMARFAAGEMRILVSTTVIEVGVDVPNATLMIVENAERFGLSQLHQLRGRVGRGSAKSYCVLCSDHRDPDTRARLKTLCETGDGFRIAQADLEQRGPGDFFGRRQHGLPAFKAASLSCDLETLKDAQEAAAAFLAEQGGIEAECPALFARIRALFADSETSFN